MLELVFTVCSIVQGAHCHTLQPVRLEGNTMMIGCVMASQFEGAKCKLLYYTGHLPFVKL